MAAWGRTVSWAAASVLGLLLASCVAAPQGLGAVHPPDAMITGRGRPSKVGYVASIGGGGLLSGGVAQARIGSSVNLAGWFAGEVGVIATGVYDKEHTALQEAQEATFNFGLMPYLAPTFFAGNVHIRLLFFGMGGGGPEAGGAMGVVGLSVGYHAEDWSVWGGGSVFGAMGCCSGGEYTARVLQVPVGASFDLPVGWDEVDLSIDVELYYTWVAADYSHLGNDYHGGGILTYLTVSGR